jgi:hypothetical protein
MRNERKSTKNAKTIVLCLFFAPKIAQN